MAKKETIYDQSIHMHFTNIYDWELFESVQAKLTAMWAECNRTFMKEAKQWLSPVCGRISQTEVVEKPFLGERPS